MPQQIQQKRLCETWITSFIDYADQVEAPDKYKLWSAISAVSSALGRKCVMMMGDLPTYANTYIILVGRAGMRKSTSINAVRKFLAELNITFSSDECSRQQLVTELINSAVYDSEGTAHATLTIFPDEFALFLGQRGTMIEKITVLNRWFDCPDSYKYTLKGRLEEVAYNVWANILASITPAALESVQSYEMQFNGFASRALMIYTEETAKLIHAPSFDKDLEQKLQHDIILINEMEGIFKPTKAYMEAYIDFRESPPEFSVNKQGLVEEYISRRTDHLRKLSFIFAASRGSYDIDKIDYDLAYELLEDYEKSLVSMFDVISGVPYRTCLRVIHLYLTTHFKTNMYITGPELYEEFAMNFPIEDLESSIETLHRANKIRYASIEGKTVLMKGTS